MRCSATPALQPSAATRSGRTPSSTSPLSTRTPSSSRRYAPPFPLFTPNTTTRQIHIYENYNPGSVVAIYAQPAPTGAAATAGGGAPLDPVQSADGTLVTPERMLTASQVFDQTLQVVNESFTTEAATSHYTNDSGASINTNDKYFIRVWGRREPVCHHSLLPFPLYLLLSQHYFGTSTSRIFAPDEADITQTTTRVTYNVNEDGVEVRWKTKVIKVVFNLSSDVVSQVYPLSLPPSLPSPPPLHRSTPLRL